MSIRALWTFLSLLGAILVMGFKMPWHGSVIWVIANCGWIYDAWKREDRSQMVLWVVYLGTAVIGVINWR